MSKLTRKQTDEFKDRDYRHDYLDGYINICLATQIRMLRKKNSLNQEDLARLAKMAQPRISALENVSYSSWSVATLKRLAKVFDVALVVRFVPFSEAIPAFFSFDQESLIVENYKQEEETPTQEEEPSHLRNIGLTSAIATSTSGLLRLVIGNENIPLKTVHEPELRNAKIEEIETPQNVACQSGTSD